MGGVGVEDRYEGVGVEGRHEKVTGIIKKKNVNVHLQTIPL